MGKSINGKELGKGITQDKYPHRRRMFDHFVWYKTRTKENNHN